MAYSMGWRSVQTNKHHSKREMREMACQLSYSNFKHLKHLVLNPALFWREKMFLSTFISEIMAIQAFKAKYWKSHFSTSESKKMSPYFHNLIMTTSPHNSFTGTGWYLFIIYKRSLFYPMYAVCVWDCLGVWMWVFFSEDVMFRSICSCQSLGYLCVTFLLKNHGNNH